MFIYISRFISLVCLFSLSESYFQQSLNKHERQRAKNLDEKRDGQRGQLRSQLRLVIRASAYQNVAAHTPYVAIIARASNLSRTIIAPRLQIYRSLVIERYVIPGGHMEMFIARPADRE